MKVSIFIFSFIFCNVCLLQAQNEAQTRMENVFLGEEIIVENQENKNLEPEKPKVTHKVEISKIKVVESPKFKEIHIPTKKHFFKKYNSLCVSASFNAQKSIALKRNLKKQITTDSLPPKNRSLQKLGCFLKEPLQLITLGVEMFELTKPPKSAFLIILYVIYIVPLFAIITSFIVGGILGLTSFILACGLFAFLLYWLILALLGITLAGQFIFWGLVGAFVSGLILYLLLIRLCR
jgi:hypothetical protein